MNKPLYVVGILLIAGFVVLMAAEMKNASTQYVTTVAEVLAARKGPVQFQGIVLHDKTMYDRFSHEMRFTLKDDIGKTIEVRYRGPKPSGFDTADRAVAVGVARDGKFHASQVLTACPSKYKGQK